MPLGRTRSESSPNSLVTENETVGNQPEGNRGGVVRVTRRALRRSATAGVATNSTGTAESANALSECSIPGETSFEHGTLREPGQRSSDSSLERATPTAASDLELASDTSDESALRRERSERHRIQRSHAVSSSLVATEYDAVGGKAGNTPRSTLSPQASASSVSDEALDADLSKHVDLGRIPLPRNLQLIAQSQILHEPHLGSIVDVRYNDELQQHEYYIHFDGWNKRLDEWLTIEHFDLSDLSERLREHYRRERASQARRRSRSSATASSGKRLRKAEHATAADVASSTAAAAAAAALGNESRADQQQKAASGTSAGADLPADVVTRVKNLHSIVIGRWEMETWYYSPLPPEYRNLRTLYVCEFTLKFFRTRDGLERHLARNTRWCPPGREIYRKDHLAVFEVDGARNHFYCQNICYISKLFLDHKTLYYDVDPFLFYVLCEIDDWGYHFVGYFSKEKASEENYNVACILTLPPYQRKGYGKFLIALSYELSRREGIRGSPEKPLSDLGLLGYRSYWSQILIDLLMKATGPLSIEDIADRTMMKTEDIIGTLRALDLVHYHEGQHVIDLRRVEHMDLGNRGMPFDPQYLRWSPPVERKRRKS